jgi:two-component system, cell cycle response regulator
MTVLSAPRKVAEMAHGAIAVERLVGKGSVLTVTLPLTPTKRRYMPKARILIVDDNPSSLKFAARVLESYGYVVSTAPSSELALERISERKPDLILMDVRLPLMDGLALTRGLKADTTTRSIPIIAMTAFAMEGDEQKARDAGCDGYLINPINTRAVLVQVAEFLRASKRRALVKILVVEDLPSDRQLVRTLLTSAGYHVVEAETGEIALTAARKNPPDVILLDLKLPGIDGIEVIRQLRQGRTTRAIPIVAVTAYRDRSIELQAHEAGCTAYLTKPVDASVLLRQVRELASRGRPSEQLAAPLIR